MKSSFSVKSMARVLISTLLLAALAAGLASCQSENLIERRNDYLDTLPKGRPVKLAVVWSHLYGDSYYKGVQMAVKEINAKGGVADHPVKTILINKFNNLDQGRLAVYPLGQDMDIAFALGFYKSEIAQSLVQLTQYYGVPVLINANAKDILKNRWGDDVFRGTVTTDQFGSAIYNECIKQGVKNVIICYSSEKFTAAVAAAMISKFRENSEVDAQIYRIDDLTNEWRYRLMDAVSDTEFRKNKTAGIILMNDLDVVKDLASILTDGHNIKLLFTTQSGFDVHFNVAQDLTIKLKTQLIFPADMVNASLKQIAQSAPSGSLIRRLMRKGGVLPDPMLLYGYEQTMAVAQAMNKANSVEPFKVVRALEDGKYKGLMQTYAFTDKGELKNPNFYLISIRDGKVSLRRL